MAIKHKKNGGWARFAEAVSVVSGCLVVIAAFAQAELLAAVPRSPAEEQNLSLRRISDWPVFAQVAPDAPRTGEPAIVPPVKREMPSAPKPAHPAEASPPAETPPAKPAAQTSAEPKPIEPSGPGSGGFFGAIQEWLARANRDYQNVIIKDLSLPPAGKTAEDEIAKKLEETKAEEARKAAEQRKLDEANKDAEKKRLAEKAAEAQRKAEERKQVQDALKQAQEASKAPAAPQPALEAPKAAAQPLDTVNKDTANKDKARIAEELRKTEQAQQEEAKKKLEAEKLEAQRADATRIAKEKLEAERQAAEAKKLEDEQRKADALVAEERRKAEAREQAERERADAARAERVQPPAAEQPEPRADKRRVVITAEPLRRPETVGETYRPELKGKQPSRRAVSAADDDHGVEIGSVAAKVRTRHIRLYRVADARLAYRGTAVRRWVYRASSGAGRCRGAGRTIAPPSHYIVARGDSLWRISDSHYSSGRKWPRIYRANRARIADPDLIYPCQRFWVPRR